MSEVTIIGIDLAKRVFQVHGNTKYLGQGSRGTKTCRSGLFS